MPAAERREMVLEAAVAEFAAHGLAGTSTEDVARRAGISQPYLFRLFPTKKALFLALVERCFRRVEGTFTAAAGDLTGDEALTAMADAYTRLLDDRTLLLLQMQIYAACGDPEIRDATRAAYKHLWEMVERITGLPFQTVVDFFAVGMLMNVAAAMDLPSVDERWTSWCPKDADDAPRALASPKRSPHNLIFFQPTKLVTTHFFKEEAMTARHRTAWTFAVTSAALFMASLDNLVVTTALPSIREQLHASLEGLQWTVNAYTLTFAVLLLTGATLGERYGRRRLFTIGLGLFTAGSAAAAMAPGIGALVAARAVQGVGAAIVIPLTLTLLSAAVSPRRRGLALGAWGAVGGLAIAIGPLVGGAVVEGASWQWIFWLNVPIGIALLPIARLRLTESRGPSTSLDLPGLVLASVGLLGIVLGVVRGNDHGWTSLTVLPPLVIGALLVAAFIGWELRAREPMLPLHLFRSRGFAVTNAASLLMFFGMFGSIFLLAQFLQVVQHYSPLEAGLRTLPWTAMPVFIAPVAGALSDRIGGRPLLVTGLALQAIGLGWLAVVTSPTVSYLTLVPAFVVSGVGMSLFFAPVANVVLSSVRRDQEGIASGANNAIRELGGVFGIAVLGAVFSARGGYASGTAFVSGLAPAVWVGAAAVAAAAAAALLLPRLRKTEASPAVEEVPVLVR